MKQIKYMEGIENEARESIKEVTSWKTSDGGIHSIQSWAAIHEQNLIRMRYANSLLENGASIGTILDAVGLYVPDEILYNVTKDSRLVIKHYQCRETPGYMPLGFNIHMDIRCFGDAGSWSGPYGNYEDAKRVALYAKEEGSEL